jgi:serine/threonine protein phosphatase 1
MKLRTIAIGGIPGCSAAIDALLEAIQPHPEDELTRRCRLIPILGKYDQKLREARSRQHPATWIGMGGIGTLDSYGPGRDIWQIPETHFRFVEGCRDFYETETHIFVHANHLPDLPMRPTAKGT